MKRPMLFLGLAGVAVGVAAVRRAHSAKQASLRALDAQFHAAYDRLRALDARAAPVLVLIGDSLIAFEGDRQKRWPATAPTTQLIKAAAHVPVGIFVTLRERPDPEAALDVSAVQRLNAMRGLQTQALGSLDSLDPESRADVAQVLETSYHFVEQVLGKGRASAAELSSFASAIGPLLLRLTEHATHLELAALHAAVESALGEMTAEQREKLEVVVAGVHQARSRSLGLQYFQKRFGEAPGEERRVTYAEAAADALEARTLIGTRRLDREIASAFFGDAKKLQSDVLGDAAKRQLKQIELGRLQPASAPQPSSRALIELSTAEEEQPE